MPDQPPPLDGLSAAEAARLLARDGPNSLPSSRPRGAWPLLREVVAEPMFLLLVACGAIYLVLGDRGEALMLLGFVGVVIAISFVQQRRAQRSLEALRDLSSPRALVLRDGVQTRVAGCALVVGDVVLLAEGDRVPADLTLLQSSNLSVDESMLTGESQAVFKHTAGDGGAAQLYAGTLVTQGTACARVAATGERSALGRIGRSLAALGDERTPIQLETARIVRLVAGAGLALAAALALAYWWTLGDWLRGLLAGVTFAMAVLPEELPVVLTLFLGLGAWRLARERVLARSVPAIELLGATTILCVDKTGTLTRNRMELRQLWSDGASYHCRPAGAHAAVRPDAPAEPLPEALHGLLEYAVLASHRQAFDPMESAIVTAGRALLADTEHLHADWTLVDDYPLSREMLAMSRVWRSPSSRERLIAAKGAPEAIVDLCHLDAPRRAAIAAQVDLMARDGLRVLGVAWARFGDAALPERQHDFDFEFLGLIGMEDPVRDEVPAAIAACHGAGIRVVMITGDHPATALAIARQAGIGADAAPLGGPELAALDEAALQARLRGVQVCCRIAPEQKLQLVQAFRRAGEVVAMTGDGVNDAPALRAANIGVAMGARGTDVAREAAALVLLDDDFSSLLAAVRQGRRLFANLRKAIVFIAAAHVPIVGLSLLPVPLGWPMLLMPVHILFLQLIIDPACSIVFEAEDSADDAMRARPRRPDARLFERAALLRGLWQGAGVLAILLGLYALVRHQSGSDALARSAMFIVLVWSNLALIQANRRAPAQPRGALRTADRYFALLAVAAGALLAVALGVPGLRTLFAFAPPDPALLAPVLGAGAAVALWLALLAMLARSRRPGRALP